jgi:hypothetical protein
MRRRELPELPVRSRVGVALKRGLTARQLAVVQKPGCDPVLLVLGDLASIAEVLEQGGSELARGVAGGPAGYLRDEPAVLALLTRARRLARRATTALVLPPAPAQAGIVAARRHRSRIYRTGVPRDALSSTAS